MPKNVDSNYNKAQEKKKLANIRLSAELIALARKLANDMAAQLKKLRGEQAREEKAEDVVSTNAEQATFVQADLPVNPAALSEHLQQLLLDFFKAMAAGLSEESSDFEQEALTQIATLQRSGQVSAQVAASAAVALRRVLPTTNQDAFQLIQQSIQPTNTPSALPVTLNQAVQVIQTNVQNRMEENFVNSMRAPTPAAPTPAAPTPAASIQPASQARNASRPAPRPAPRALSAQEVIVVDMMRTKVFTPLSNQVASRVSSHMKMILNASKTQRGGMALTAESFNQMRVSELVAISLVGIRSDAMRSQAAKEAAFAPQPKPSFSRQEEDDGLRLS